MAEVKVTMDNFEEEVIKSELPVLVDFWAVWCGPCQMLAPTIAEIAEEYEGKYKVCKVNVDEELALAQMFKISSIPTLLVFKEGKVVNMSLGYKPKDQVLALLD